MADLGRRIGNRESQNYNLFGLNSPEKPPPSVFDAYQGAIKQTGSDYDELMNNYRNQMKSGPIGTPISDTYRSGGPSGGGGVANPAAVNYTPQAIPPSILFNPTAAPTQTQFTPTAAGTPSTFNPSEVHITPYSEGADTTSAIANLKGLADTGGYTAQGQQDIRERGISPIRSVYANAQRGLERSKALGGGYSPNNAAVTAKMAREQSGLVSGAVTDINAGLAQNIAANRLSAAPMYSGAVANEAAQRTNAEQMNTGIRNQVAQFNTTGRTQNEQFNANLAAEIAKANASGMNQNAQFNAGNINAVNMANATGQNEMGRFNTKLGADIAGQNAGNQLTADVANANARNRANEFNANLSDRNTDRSIDVQKYNNELLNADQARRMKAQEGMVNLYGTNPALASTFGNQALNQQKIDEDARQFEEEQRRRRGEVLVGAYGGRG